MQRETEAPGAPRAERMAVWAVASATLGLVAAAFVYWLVLPAVVFGGTAVVLGVLSRRNGGLGKRGHDLATVAICLGAVAVLLTPVVLMVAQDGEDWGRSCALDPDHDPNCPD